METVLRLSFFPFVMHICGAKFQENCFNISRDIFYSVFYRLYTLGAHFPYNEQLVARKDFFF